MYIRPLPHRILSSVFKTAFFVAIVASSLLAAAAETTVNTREGADGYFKWSKQPEEAFILLAYQGNYYGQIYGKIKEIRSKAVTYDSGDTFYDYSTQKFDKQGRLIKDSYTDSDGSMSAIFDANTFTSSTELEYLPSGQGVRVTYKDNQDMSGIYLLKYDPKKSMHALGNVKKGPDLVRFSFNNKTGEFSSSWYQDKPEEGEGQKGFELFETCYLNQQGLLAKGCTAPDETEQDAVIFEYNDKGFPIAEFVRNPDGSKGVELSSSQYKYDAYGNWTERKDFFGQKVFTVVERQLSYY